MKVFRPVICSAILGVSAWLGSTACAQTASPDGRAADASSADSIAPDRMLALARQLERPVPRTAEEKEALESRFRKDLVDACGKPARSEKYVCAIALYILYDDVTGAPLSTMTRPIAQIVITNEFRPGHETGRSSALPPPRSEYERARYVEAPVLGKFSKQVPFESFFLNQNGRDLKTGATGRYYLAAIIGRNDRQKHNIPDAYFERRTYAGPAN